jgi:hypothetical protein
MKGAGADARRELVQRVAGSASFHKTWRLRELFLFLSERVLADPDHVVREADIGAAVFGRGADFDPGIDPLVRVQTSQLRKRLHQYFTTEGAAEPVVIEIPRGTYSPAFRERALASPPEPEAEPEDDLAAPRAPTRWLAAACVVLLAVSAVLLAQNVRLRRASPAHAPGPTVERLWRQILGPHRAVDVIAADGSLAVFLDATKRIISASEYQRRQYSARYQPDARAEPAEDPPDIRLARELMERPLTSTIDADLALRVGQLSRGLGGTATLVAARDATADHFRSHSVVISGPRRGNPWIELVDERMSFSAQYDRPANTGYFRNRTPQADEPAEYRVALPQTAYCRVALTPNLDGSGWLLLITGTDVAAGRAGVELVTDEARLAEIARALEITEDPLPPFEVMLRVNLLADAPRAFERVAHRVHRSPPR